MNQSNYFICHLISVNIEFCFQISVYMTKKNLSPLKYVDITLIKDNVTGLLHAKLKDLTWK